MTGEVCLSSKSKSVSTYPRVILKRETSNFSDSSNEMKVMVDVFPAKQLCANLPAAWKNNYHYFMRWVEGDYSLGNKSIPPLVMINLPSV